MRLSQLRHGLALFNATRFFDSHEALEDVWREAPRHSLLRRHLQGLVQLAVAFHHQSTGNYVGARSVLKRGVRNLEGAEESLPELDLAKLRSSLDAWREYLDADDHAPDGRHAPKVVGEVAPGLSAPALPQITLRNEHRH
jgi:predicted metal-dependent hydrolase